MPNKATRVTVLVLAILCIFPLLGLIFSLISPKTERLTWTVYQRIVEDGNLLTLIILLAGIITIWAISVSLPQ
ncbi:hypothetical protein BLNAU_11910 [Blattamonas nauphoetae]|uniref:Uncharacterized protein n=1 Tax=Blattamonas nauphoetae TaxID=2049346 RepID=A0ABQ9XQL4_9EUKA|nr:hypothetical protein BLNAU_11910 [Blattamonas nauphoetae]